MPHKTILPPLANAHAGVGCTLGLYRNYVVGVVEVEQHTYTTWFAHHNVLVDRSQRLNVRGSHVRGHGLPAVRVWMTGPVTVSHPVNKAYLPLGVVANAAKQPAFIDCRWKCMEARATAAQTRQLTLW